MVLGPPGAGKSTLAGKLGEKYGLPVFHLDQAFHLPGWRQAAPEVFRAEVERIAALPEWVIDGNFLEFAEARIRAADTMIYLDAASWVAMLRVLRRLARNYGRVRADMPAGCPERLDWEFLRFVWGWNRERRARTLGLLEGFGGRKIVLRGRREVAGFLAG
jgi:adenylate kinase family enzyme